MTAAHGAQHGGELLGEHSGDGDRCLLAPEERRRGRARSGRAPATPSSVQVGSTSRVRVAKEPAPIAASLRSWPHPRTRTTNRFKVWTGGPDDPARSGADDVAKGGRSSCRRRTGFRPGLGVRGQRRARPARRGHKERNCWNRRLAGIAWGRSWFLTHSTWLRAGSGLWLGFGFWRERSRVAGEIARPAGF